MSDSDRVAFEMRTLIDCLFTAGSYDQLNVPSLACMEIISRRVQGTVDAYSAGSPGNPDWSSARVITGYKGAEDAISPALRAWAARRSKEEVDLAVSRARFRDHRRGLQIAIVVEEASASAVADGVLPNAGQGQGKAWKRAAEGSLPQMASESGGASGTPGTARHGYQSGHARPAFALGNRDLFPLPM